MIREYIALILFILGTVIFGISVFGTFKFKYVLNRMHAQALSDTMGIFLMITGGSVYYGFSWELLKLLVILLFMWLTGPVATHLIADLHVTHEVNKKNPEFKNLTGEEFVREEGTE